MRLKTILTILVIFATITNYYGQGQYQNFSKSGFKVKCDCSFYKDTVFLKKAKEQGIDKVFAAYICAENKDNYEKGVINNILIYDESQSYVNISEKYYDYFEKKCLEQYVKNLSNAGISYRIINYQGVNAVEYTFMQMELPTKAIYFFKNKKSYLLQSGTRTNLNSKFNTLKSSFVIF